MKVIFFIVQIELVCEDFAAILTGMGCSFGVFYNHMSLDAIAMLGGHITQCALKHTLSFRVGDLANKPTRRGCCELSQTPVVATTDIS